MAEIRCDIPIAYVERLWNDTCVFVMFYLSSRSFLTWRLLWKCRSAEIKPMSIRQLPKNKRTDHTSVSRLWD